MKRLSSTLRNLLWETLSYNMQFSLLFSHCLLRTRSNELFRTNPLSLLKSPSQPEWGLAFPEARRAGPWGPRHNSRGTPIFPTQLEKNHEILPSTRDEALFQSSVSREIPRSLLKWEKETQEVHWHSHPHSRGTWSFPAHLNLSPFSPPHFEMRVDSPAFSRKESQSSRHTSEEAGLILKLETNPRGCATIPKTPISPSTQAKAWWPCPDLNVTSSIESQHEGPLTPRLHPPSKASGSKSNSTRGPTPHSQLKRKAEFNVWR